MSANIIPTGEGSPPGHRAPPGRGAAGFPRPRGKGALSFFGGASLATLDAMRHEEGYVEARNAEASSAPVRSLFGTAAAEIPPPAPAELSPGRAAS